MEYDLFTDEYGHPTVRCSMESEAIGRWLTDECNSPAKAEQLQQIINELKDKQRFDYQQSSDDWVLRMTHGDVEVIASSLGFESDEELPEELSFYDQESVAGCGLDDFAALLQHWATYMAGQ